MGDGKHCPACGVDIGVWPIFSAGLPNLIRCPRRKARLGYRRIGPLRLILLLLTVAVLAAAYWVSMPFDGNQRPVVFLVVALGAWIPVEVIVALYLRGNKVLFHRASNNQPGGLSA